MSLGREVAPKVLPWSMLPTRGSGAVPARARASARLHHTNIVPVFEIGEDGGVHYYAMQYIQGQSLDEVLDELRRLRREKRPPDPGPRAEEAKESPPATRWRRWRGPCSPTKGNHRAPLPSGARPRRRPRTRRGPTRRDAAASGSAAALMLSASGGRPAGPVLDGRDRRGDLPAHRGADRPPGGLGAGQRPPAGGAAPRHQAVQPAARHPGHRLVTDVGLAKVGDEHDLTNTGDVLGTLRYLAPEAFAGRGDARSDIYSLGLTLYELLLLRPAFD